MAPPFLLKLGNTRPLRREEFYPAIAGPLGSRLWACPAAAIRVNLKSRKASPARMGTQFGRKPDSAKPTSRRVLCLGQRTPSARQSSPTAASALLVGPPFGYAFPGAGFEPCVTRW